LSTPGLVLRENHGFLCVWLVMSCINHYVACGAGGLCASGGERRSLARAHRRRTPAAVAAPRRCQKRAHLIAQRECASTRPSVFLLHAVKGGSVSLFRPLSVAAYRSAACRATRWSDVNQHSLTRRWPVLGWQSNTARGTKRWRELRPYVWRHHHVQKGSDNDLKRVARHLAGQSVGVVLAGGGCRGLAHLGALRALQAAGVPIDVVGGTSQVHRYA
jgi:hypothetical protein